MYRVPVYAIIILKMKSSLIHFTVKLCARIHCKSMLIPYVAVSILGNTSIYISEIIKS